MKCSATNAMLFAPETLKIFEEKKTASTLNATINYTRIDCETELLT